MARQFLPRGQRDLGGPAKGFDGQVFAIKLPQSVLDGLLATHEPTARVGSMATKHAGGSRLKGMKAELRLRMDSTLSSGSWLDGSGGGGGCLQAYKLDARPQPGRLHDIVARVSTATLGAGGTACLAPFRTVDALSTMQPPHPRTNPTTL